MGDDMNYDVLKGLLRERNITVVPKESMCIRGYDVDTYRKLAKQTETIDYDCDFHDGICHGLALGASGCCMHCASAFGYWHKEGGAIDEDTLRRTAEFFDERTGFLREGAGCIIPRELRSPTCLYIFCSDAKMSGQDRALLYRIQFGKNWS
jgi:hypothetical protein